VGLLVSYTIDLSPLKGMEKEGGFENRTP